MNAMNVSPNVPADVLEVRAAEQRRRIHESVLELRTKVDQKLDVQRQAREHVWPASGIATFAGLVLGWGLAGLFSAR